MTKGEISLAISGTGRGWDLGVAFGSFTIERGETLGLVKLKMFRPFPGEALRAACKSAARIAVLDRNYAAGAGGIFWQEARAAFQGHRDDLLVQDMDRARASLREAGDFLADRKRARRRLAAQGLDQAALDGVMNP